jgi:hypothetical protein
MGKIAVEDSPVERHSGAVLAVASVEAGRVVVSEEHQDGDAVERGDVRHKATVSGNCDRSSSPDGD